MLASRGKHDQRLGFEVHGFMQRQRAQFLPERRAARLPAAQQMDAALAQQAAAVDAVVWIVMDGPDPGHTGMDDIDYELDSDSTSFSSSNYEGIMRMASRLAAAADYSDAPFEADIEAMLALDDRLREEEQRDEDKAEAERATWILVAEEIDLMEGELLEESVRPTCGYIAEHGHACSHELGVEVGDEE